jgi:hypothetical protein
MIEETIRKETRLNTLVLFEIIELRFSKDKLKIRKLKDKISQSDKLIMEVLNDLK